MSSHADGRLADRSLRVETGHCLLDLWFCLVLIPLSMSHSAVTLALSLGMLGLDGRCDGRGDERSGSGGRG